jgi:hypothetical protein
MKPESNPKTNSIFGDALPWYTSTADGKDVYSQQNDTFKTQLFAQQWDHRFFLKIWVIQAIQFA